MIYAPLSSYTRSKEYPLAAGATLSADGQALVLATTAGVVGAAPSANSASEKFIGFLNAQTSAVPFLQTTAVKVEKFVVPAGGILVLALTPVASTVLVTNDATAATVAQTGQTGRNVDISGAAITGASVTVTYRYTLTAAQSRSLAGDVQPGGYSGNLVRSVSVVGAGVIYTDQFDSSINFATATSIKTFTNGQITNQTGTGPAISAVVIALPSVDFPFLGLEFSAL